MEKDQSISYAIGELADLAGTSSRTIRYYEEIGLLDPPARRSNRRFYTDSDLRRLKFIQRLKLLGLSLAEMRELKEIYAIHKSNRHVLLRVKELLDDNLNKIDRNLDDLRKLRGEISSYQQRIDDKLK